MNEILKGAMIIIDNILKDESGNVVGGLPCETWLYGSMPTGYRMIGSLLNYRAG